MQVKPTENLELVTETSWEVCNKIGGIYAVLSTKAKELKERYGDRLVFIGPDVWNDENPSPDFIERKTLLKKFSSKTLPLDIKVRVGRWNVPGSPLVILVKFETVYPHLDRIYGQMWEEFKVDSLHAYGDYDEGCAFGVASAIVITELASHLKLDTRKVLSHFDEWTTGMGLLYLRSICPEVATIFTTHATSIGRSICGNGKPLYHYFENYNGDQMAQELNMESKHSLEKNAAIYADCFTTVSEVTGKECRQLLEKAPDVVTPNGFEPSFIPDSRKWESLRREGRKRLLQIAEGLTGKSYSEDTFVIATSGRNEFRNKGLDLFIDSMVRLGEETKEESREILAFILVPAWVREPNSDLLLRLHDGKDIGSNPDFVTHRLNNEDSDAVFCRLRGLSESGNCGKVKIIYLPCYLNGEDEILNISYYNILPAIDVTVFCSYYEPWGYTPLESIAFGVPTVTTDKAGFGQWVVDNFPDSLEESGVSVIPRNDDDYQQSCNEIAGELREYYFAGSEDVCRTRASAISTSRRADWQYFMASYDKAFRIALENRDKRNKKQN